MYVSEWQGRTHNACFMMNGKGKDSEFVRTRGGGILKRVLVVHLKTNIFTRLFSDAESARSLVYVPSASPILL